MSNTDFYTFGGFFGETTVQLALVVIIRTY